MRTWSPRRRRSAASVVRHPRRRSQSGQTGASRSPDGGLGRAPVTESRLEADVVKADCRSRKPTPTPACRRPAAFAKRDVQAMARR
jgi:hypothetical protein